MIAGVATRLGAAAVLLVALWAFTVATLLVTYYSLTFFSARQPEEVRQRQGCCPGPLTLEGAVGFPAISAAVFVAVVLLAWTLRESLRVMLTGTIALKLGRLLRCAAAAGLLGALLAVVLLMRAHYVI